MSENKKNNTKIVNKNVDSFIKLSIHLPYDLTIQHQGSLPPKNENPQTYSYKEVRRNFSNNNLKLLNNPNVH